jgi:hypothetical protein
MADSQFYIVPEKNPSIPSVQSLRHDVQMPQAGLSDLAMRRQSVTGELPAHEAYRSLGGVASLYTSRAVELAIRDRSDADIALNIRSLCCGESGERFAPEEPDKLNNPTGSGMARI